jgi:cytochrome c-type biogenesis protein CcmH
MSKRILFTALMISLITASFQLSPAIGQDEIPVSDDQINEVARELYCPVCENISLDVCPTQACAQWRDLIREKLEAGWTPEEIKGYFATQYGDRVLPEPPKRGINWLVYILPPAMIVAGAFMLLWIIKGLRSQRIVTTVTENTITESSGDEFIARIEEELKKRENT